MGVMPEEVKLEPWRNGGRSSLAKEEERGTTTGCWMNFRLMASCISSRSKVDSSISTAISHCGSLPLPWSIRMKIALGAAKGLAFLHEEAERPVIYRDFKTSNILLDVDYNAKLSDFGLAKDGPEGDKTHVSTRVMGTYGYAAPEYVMTGHLTSKSDVYSFGVVLLEMMTGRRSMDKKRPNGEHSLVEWARHHLGERRRFYRLMDPRLEGSFSIKGAQKTAQLARHCLSRDPKARPLISEVVEALEPLINLKDMASSNYYFQSMQAERAPVHSNSLNGRNGFRTPGSIDRNGQQPARSLSYGARAASPCPSISEAKW